MTIERFAPSPTGYLHLGHGFSALTAFDAAQSTGAVFLLRIEDIDHTRCRADFETAIFEDLAWLGIHWEQPVLRQSERMLVYGAAITQLANLGLVYPCSCTRRDISQALSAPQEGEPNFSPDGLAYPRICAHRDMEDKNTGDAVRLNMTAAIDYLGGPSAVNALSYSEIGVGKQYLSAERLVSSCGDVVLARKEFATSYGRN